MSETIDRRQFIGTVAALAPAGAAAAALPDDRAGPESTLKVEVSINGGKLTFDQRDGEDLGDFHGPGFVQRCVRVTRPDSALTVYFRPDRESGRSEVVFELGRLWGKPNEEAANLGPHYVKILRGDSVVAQGEVAKHWWFSSWRWVSTPRPIVRGAAGLIAAGLVPPLSRQASRNASTTKPVAYHRPMNEAGLFLAMGTAGERPDIGPVTEWQAEYLVTGRRAALHSVMAQAEAAGSVPWHTRDETTGAPVDLYEHPTANWHSQRVEGTQHILTAKTDWLVDIAHQPALAYVPYLLTGDPYHLENLQFQGTYNVGWSSYHREAQGLPVIYPGETRSFAWGLRTLAQLAKVTPEKTPGWLLPRAYWKRMLDDNLTYFNRTFVDDDRPSSSIFRAATRQDDVSAWQENYLAFSLGSAVLLGFEEWRRAFEWKVGSTIALSNGKSGWPRQWCCPYYYVLRPATDAPFYRSWGEAWEGFKADPANKVEGPFPDRASWAQPNTIAYLLYTRAVLALAVRLGIDGSRECYKFVDAMTTDALPKRGEKMVYRWAVAGPD